MPAGTYAYTITANPQNGCDPATGIVQVGSPAAWVPTLGVTPISCSGVGNIEVQTGGNYGYQWNTGSTTYSTNVSSPGTYTVTVTDQSTANNCTVTASGYVDYGPSTNISGISVEQLCLGNNATLTIAGLTGFANANCDVTYEITGTNLVTPVTGTITNQPIDGTGSSQNIQIPATTGLPPSAGIYTFTIITISLNGNSSCLISPNNIYTTFEINSPPTLIITSNANTPLSPYFCKGQDVLLRAKVNNTNANIPGYSYAWAGPPQEGTNTLWQWGNINNAGVYNVTVTDADKVCSVSATTTVTEVNVSVTLTSTDPLIICNGNADVTLDADVTPTGGTYTYQWSTNPANSITNLPANSSSETVVSVSASNNVNVTVTVTDSPSGCTATANSVILVQDITNAEVLSIAAPVCGGGSALLTAYPDGPGYTYLWSNAETTSSISVSSSNTYQVTITDPSNCSATASATIVAASSPTVALNVLNDVTCAGGNDGAIDANPQSGTAPYGYSWSSGQTVEDPNDFYEGTYAITVTDANNCSVSATATVDGPDAIVITKDDDTEETCYGLSDGSIDISVTGGVGPYDYLWSNSSTNEDPTGLTAGTYTVTVTDANSCSATFSILLHGPGNISISQGANFQDVLCNAGSTGIVDIDVYPATTYSYLWNTSATTEDLNSVTAGTYAVTVTNAAGCTATASFALGEPDELQVEITSSNKNTICNFQDVTLTAVATGGFAPVSYSYAWNSVGANTDELITNAAGTYTVTVTDGNGCTISDSWELNYLFPTSRETSYNACFSNDGTDVNLFFCDALNTACFPGSPPYTFTWNPSGPATPTLLTSIPQPQYQSTGLSPGSYILTVEDDAGCQINVNIQIYSQSPLNITGSIGQTDCGNATINGSIDLTVTGGVNGETYNFAWSNGSFIEDPQDFSSAGTYTVTVSDFTGCTATASFTIPALVSCCFVGNPTLAEIIQITTNVNANTLTIPSGSFVYVAPNVTITVTSNDVFTFDDCEVVLGQGAKIVVQSDGELHIENSYLHACDVMWDGITAQAGAMVIATGTSGDRSVIEDAITAIASQGGAEIHASNTDFVNNRVGISITNGGAYAGSVEGCSFSYASPGLLPPFTGKHPLTGIEVLNTQHWHVPELGHTGNTFTGLSNGIYARQSGLSTASPNGFYVYGNTFADIAAYEPCNNLGCKFTTAHHGSAIYVSGKAPVSVIGLNSPPQPVSFPQNLYYTGIYNGSYNNCHTGVKLESINAEVQGATMSNVNYGINAAQCWYDVLLIHQNTMTTTAHGVLVNSNTGARVHVYDNNITVRNLVSGLSIGITGIAGKTPKAIGNGVTEDYYAVKLIEGLAPSGYTRIYNNTLSFGRNTIELENPQKGCEVYDNDIYQSGTQNVQLDQTGILVRGGQKFSIRENVITGSGSGQTVTPYTTNAFTASDDRKRGIAILQGRTYELVCNDLSYLQRSIYFQGNCDAANPAIRRNEMEYYDHGLHLQVLGQPGWVGGSIGNEDTVNNNDWFDNSNTSMLETYNQTLTNGANFPTRLYWTNSAIPTIQHGANVTAAAVTDFNADQSAFEITNCASYPLKMLHRFSELDYAIAADTMQYDQFATIAKWQGEKMLFEKAAALNAVDSLTDTTMLAFYEDNERSATGRTETYKLAFGELADSTINGDSATIYNWLADAYDKIELIPDTPFYVYNIKDMSRLVMQVMAYGKESLDSATIERIEDLAFTCPYLEGEGVYLARYLYEQINDTTYHIDDLLLCEEPSAKWSETEAQQNNKAEVPVEGTELEIIPNPTTGSAKVIYRLQKDEHAELNLFALNGQKLLTLQLTDDRGIVPFNTGTVANGVYIYKVKGHKGSTFVGKLVVTK